MKKQEIIEAITELSQSQGCWGRLLQQIGEMPEKEREEYLQALEDKNFKDALDLILFLEGNE